MEDRQQAAALIMRLGHPPASVLYDPHYLMFMVPGIDGFVGYRVESKCAVVTGDPVCAENDMPALAFAFHEHCQKNGWSVIYLIVSEHFCRWAVGKVCRASVRYGEELIVDPAIDPSKGRKGEKLRWKVHKAVEDGVVIHEYLGHHIDLEKDIELASNRWLKSRKGPQIYLADLDIFACRFGKRWFYAKKEDRIVGLLVINRVDKHDGWVLNLLMATPDSPVGTSEHLMMTVIEQLRAENCHFFSLGAAPRKSLSEIVGLNPLSTLIARVFFKIANWLFHLHSRRQFLKKFLPTSVPSYLLFSQSKIGLNELRAIKKSTNISF